MCQHMERKYQFCYHLCWEGTKEVAAEAFAKWSLLLQGGQPKKPKSECWWQRCSQPPGLAAPEHFVKGSPSPQFCFNFSPHMLEQGWSPPLPLHVAEWKSFTGHTVGIFVKMWKCFFSTFWCPMGIMYLIRALFWFLDCLWFKNPERKLLLQLF